MLLTPMAGRAVMVQGGERKRRSMQSIMAGMAWKPTSGKSISWLMRAAVDCMWSLIGRAHRTGPRIKLCPFGHHEVLVDL